MRPKPATRNFAVRKPNLVGRPLGRVPELAGSGVVVSRFSRGGVVEVARPETPLRLDDILHAVGPEEGLDAVAAAVGNSNRALNSPPPIPFFLGIALGVIVGAIPFAVPGLPAAVKLGFAGGPLVVAILLSRVANTGPLVWYLPTNANHMLREIGITLFLAAVGLKSGEKFMEVLLGGDGLRWRGRGKNSTTPSFAVCWPAA